MPFPGSRLLYWPARQVFHNVGSFNWASCQSRVPQVASVLQSGGAAWVGLAAPLSVGGRPGIAQVDGSKVGVATSSGLGRGDPAIRQPA